VQLASDRPFCPKQFHDHWPAIREIQTLLSGHFEAIEQTRGKVVRQAEKDRVR
jgi:hypothetical protein